MNKKLLLDLLEQSIAEIDAHLDAKNFPLIKEPEEVENVMEQFADPMEKFLKMAEKVLVPQQHLPVLRRYPEYDLFIMRDELIKAHGFVKFNC